MKRQQQPNKLQLKNRKKRNESLSTCSQQSDAGTSSSSAASYRRPLLPASRLATLDQASDSAAAAEPKEGKSLLEKLAEMEEKKARDMKWTPLPPPNLELYLREPVILLNWDDSMGNSNSELTVDDRSKDEEYTTGAYDITGLDSTADDDSFANLSQLTARLEDELSILGSQDMDIELENQGDVVDKGGNDQIPPAPDLNEDDSNDDDDEYGSGSDMDLFGVEDYDRLYDNVDQQLQQGGADAREEERRSFSALTSQQGGSEAHYRKEGSSSKINRSAIERTLETIRQYTDSDTLQQPAPRARSPSSSEFNFSPDSDNFDPPPVSWGCGSRPITSTASALSASSTTSSTSSTAAADTAFSMRTIKDEQLKAHCSKDILQPSTPLQSTSVAEKCPECDFTFPMGYTQLEVDEHVAVCLSVVDWEGTLDFS